MNFEPETRNQNPLSLIGEAINTAGRPALRQALRRGDFSAVENLARAQIAAGADMLDVHAGGKIADETTLLPQMVRTAQNATGVPVCLDSQNPAAIEAALRVTRGTAVINSTTADPRALEKILPLAKNFGAGVVGLCLNDSGIPPTVESRLALAETILDRAVQIGIPAENVIIDPLVLALKTHPDGVPVTLETIRRLRESLGVNVTIGGSNISFSLPNRAALNAAFLALAIAAGVTHPIVNVLQPEVVAVARATERLLPHRIERKP